jgi:Mg-chelatase subunit ChlD
MTESTTVLHIYFVLDRSGSMSAIADDVIGGFNSFLATQKADGSDALMTLIQFDSGDPHEILCDAAPINEVPDLTPATFLPRGGTPLYDAMGHTIADASIRAERRRAGGKGPEEVLFVTFTDGQENQSVEYDQKKVFDLIKKREASGWTFAYLGANQDSYVEAQRMGVSAGSTQNYRADSKGTAAAYASLSAAVVNRRAKLRRGEHFDRGDLFEGNKEAEDDLNQRS